MHFATGFSTPTRMRPWPLFRKHLYYRHGFHRGREGRIADRAGLGLNDAFDRQGLSVQGNVVKTAGPRILAVRLCIPDFP